jgi:2,5-furandicarboxylate decarboxylase 1
MGKNLRQWLIDIEKRFPGELLHCPVEIAPSGFAASALLETFERQSKYPAVLFESLRDLKGSPTQFRLLMNAFATVPKIGAALGAERPKRVEVMDRYMKMQASPKDTVTIKKAKSPVKEMVWTGKDVDLKKLPIPRINEMDGGPYITPIVVARHPQTGRYNVSWNRCMLIDRNHLGIWMSPRHLWTYAMTAEEQGKSVPVAVVLGHHPAFFLVGAGLTKMDQDEYRVAGGVMGESVEVVPSEIFGSDLLVPSEAEIVLEGEIVKDKRTIEGPFGEFTGYTGPQRLSWLVEIKAVTARKDGIIVNIFGGHQDNIYAHYPIQADIYANIKAVIPNVVDVSWVDSGGPLNMIISIRKKTEGEQMRAAMAAFSQSNFIKHVILVDDDIDPGDLKQVMWAVATRVQADKDVNIIKGMQGQVLDPSLEHEIRGAGLIIDATKPSNEMYAIKAQPPEELVKEVDMIRYFPGQKI